MFEACTAAGQALSDPSTRVGLNATTVPAPLILPGDLAAYTYLVTCTVRITDRGSEVALASSKATQPGQATHMKASFAKTANHPKMSGNAARPPPPLQGGLLVMWQQPTVSASACGQISLRHHPDTGYDCHPAVVDASMHLSACGAAAPTLRIPAAAGFYGRARWRGAETVAWPTSLQSKPSDGLLVAGFTMTSDTEPAGSGQAFTLADLQLRTPTTHAAPTQKASSGSGMLPGLCSYVIEWQASSAGLRLKKPHTSASRRPVLQLSSVSLLSGRRVLGAKKDLPSQVVRGCAKALGCLQQLLPASTFVSTFESHCIGTVVPATGEIKTGSTLAAAVAAMLRTHSAETGDRVPVACAGTSPLDELSAVHAASSEPESGLTSYPRNAQGVRFQPILKPAVHQRTTWLDSVATSEFEGEARIAVAHTDLPLQLAWSHSCGKLNAGGTVLISGGLGALGGLVGRWISTRTTASTRIALLGRSTSFKAPDGLASAPPSVLVTVLKSDISIRRDCGYLSRTYADPSAPTIFVHAGDYASS